MTRQVQRTGRTRGDRAEQAPDGAAGAGRHRQRGSGLTAESRFAAAAELWLASVEQAADVGRPVPQHRPALRAAAARTMSCRRWARCGCERSRRPVDRLPASAADDQRRGDGEDVPDGRLRCHGPCGAARRGARSTRPGGRPDPWRPTQAATGADQRRSGTAGSLRWRRTRRRSRKDLPDLTRWMLATGVRIGEALAVAWSEVDLDAGSVEVDWKLDPDHGRGLAPGPAVKGGGDRTLPLPQFAVDHAAATHSSGPAVAGPVFPDSLGGWRDPSNTSRDLREARGRGRLPVGDLARVPEDLRDDLDEAGLSARADRGPARPRQGVDDAGRLLRAEGPSTGDAAALEAVGQRTSRGEKVRGFIVWA